MQKYCLSKKVAQNVAILGQLHLFKKSQKVAQMVKIAPSGHPVAEENRQSRSDFE
jgi:hypothetical protein